MRRHAFLLWVAETLEEGTPNETAEIRRLLLEVPLVFRQAIELPASHLHI